MFTFDSVSFAYGADPVLSISSLTIEPGEVLAVLGENGAGKTTFLKLLAGLLKEDSGTIQYRNVSDWPKRKPLMQTETLFVHQNPYLFAGTVGWNISSAVLSTPRRAELSGIIDQRLQQLGLNGFDGRHIDELSTGERKRVALARALAAEPKVLLLDEPTASVDEETRKKINAVVGDLSANGTTVVFTSHEHSTAYTMADTVIEIRARDVHAIDMNILKGKITDRCPDVVMFTSEDCTIACPAHIGECSAAVLAYDDVILAKNPIDSSARNQLLGRVVEVCKCGGRYRVCVDCGAKICAHVTSQSLNRFNISVGTSIYAVFKASSVKLY